MKTQNRHHRWLSILIPLWFICTHGRTVAAEDNNKQATPNIVLFLVDDMGWIEVHASLCMQRLFTDPRQPDDRVECGTSPGYQLDAKKERDQ